MPIRPLLARPGARFTCAGDGLCCTDIHALGPLGREEQKAFRLLLPGALVRYTEPTFTAIQPNAQHHCPLLAPSGCALHANGGPLAKPNTCRRFPYGLAITPRGGRVSTNHRCPCRSLGERPPVQLDDAEKSLSDRGGRLWSDVTVGPKVALSARRRVAFSTYEAIEAELFACLEASGDPFDALGARPLPPLAGPGWDALGHSLRSEVDGSASGEAFGWFGDALLQLSGSLGPTRRARPWAEAFDRAEKRSAEVEPSAVFADWVADEIWSLRWTHHGPFDLARSELATRYAVGRRIAQTLDARGARPDRAAAEAVMVAELVGSSSLWADVTRSIRAAARLETKAQR
ncbi:MAG: hypothetical protein MUF34_20630 [Polyangiaceae bacterium]|jgi:hypothetical protein|nr:hypothetical protein [Polyangiaceae bacterium]